MTLFSVSRRWIIQHGIITHEYSVFDEDEDKCVEEILAEAGNPLR